MAAEAEATREARAKVIAAEGEQRASRALKEASDILCQSPSAIQLRYLQTLSNIAGEKNSTIVFPLPIEFLSNFMSFQSITDKPARHSSLEFTNESDNKNSREKKIDLKKLRTKPKDTTDL